MVVFVQPGVEFDMVDDVTVEVFRNRVVMDDDTCQGHCPLTFNTLPGQTAVAMGTSTLILRSSRSRRKS